MAVLDQGAHMLMDGRLYAQRKYAFPSPLLAVVELPLLREDPRTVQGTPKGHLGDTCRISGGHPGESPVAILRLVPGSRSGRAGQCAGGEASS